jgi:hypothetical protein
VTSSINGTRYFDNSGATVYSASKAGQLALVQMLAVELGPSNIERNQTARFSRRPRSETCGPILNPPSRNFEIVQYSEGK